MLAAVYKGEGHVAAEEIPVPEIGRGEMLVRVETCGVCHTDLKKVQYNLLPPPRVYGHEIAGVVAAVGEGVTSYSPGDRVVVFHHVPCGNCFYCRRRLYAARARQANLVKDQAAGAYRRRPASRRCTRNRHCTEKRGQVPVPDEIGNVEPGSGIYVKCEEDPE